MHFPTSSNSEAAKFPNQWPHELGMQPSGSTARLRAGKVLGPCWDLGLETMSRYVKICQDYDYDYQNLSKIVWGTPQPLTRNDKETRGFKGTFFLDRQSHHVCWKNASDLWKEQILDSYKLAHVNAEDPPLLCHGEAWNQYGLLDKIARTIDTYSQVFFSMPRTAHGETMNIDIMGVLWSNNGFISI